MRVADRGRAAGLLAALAGCTARDGESSAPELVETPRRSCRATAAPSQVELQRPGAAATISGRNFIYAWRRRGDDVDVVIVSLDARGELSIVPVPVPYADSVAMGGDAGGLVIVWVPLRGTGTLLRVALAEDGALQPGTPVALPGVAWGWPGQLRVEGSRAVLRHTLATAEQTAGETVDLTIDLTAQQVVSTAKVVHGEADLCEAGGCTKIGMTRAADGGGPGRLRVRDVEVDVASKCPAFYVIAGRDEQIVVAPGDPWRAVRVAAGDVGEVKLDPGLAAAAGCGPMLYEFPSVDSPGLIDGTRARSLLRWDPRARVFGRREALPDSAYDMNVRAEHPDGVIEVGWSGWSGMAHDPAADPEGQRIYFKHWEFADGTVQLLRRTDGRWEAVDAATLPLANARGTFHDGYTPVVLRNGLHASVLLAPNGGSEPAWFMPYLTACG